MLRGQSCADQADPLSLSSMNHNQQPSLAGHSDDYEAFFVDGVVRVRDRYRQGVAEDGACFRKLDAVLPQIR